MDRSTVRELERIYSKREDLQKRREYAMEHYFWVRIINEAFGGTGTRSDICDAVGGVGAMAELFKRVTIETIEQQQQECDRAIVALGGEP